MFFASVGFASKDRTQNLVNTALLFRVNDIYSKNKLLFKVVPHLFWV